MTTKEYSNLIRQNLQESYEGMFKPSGGLLKYPYISPGSDHYATQLWDWDSWLSDVALTQIVRDKGDAAEQKKALEHGKGCILNFLEYGSIEGWFPILVRQFDEEQPQPEDIYNRNMHKPVIAQHAAFLIQQMDGDAEWLREDFYKILAFVNNYRNHHRHQKTGLYYWQTDHAIGVDNDPCTYFRPDKSSGSIYLNTLMLKELEAVVYISQQLGQDELAADYQKDRNELYHAIQEHCYDERDGFFYNVDLAIRSNENITELHKNMPASWSCLIQRIGVWAGFMPLWAGIATDEQARRVVEEHYRNEATFNAPYGVRTLSKMEKMYNTKSSGNPSNWLGPIWTICNYMTFRGLVRYGYEEDARSLAEKTIHLLGRDVKRFGAMHEYYLPESGEPVLNRGFKNWNYLVLNMINWLEGKEYVTEF